MGREGDAMFRVGARRACVGVFGALALGLFVAAPAFANGPCGWTDFNGPTACPITGAGTYSGTITSSSETDFFAFWARKGTAVAVTITNTDNPVTCLVPRGDCGYADAVLDNSQASPLAWTPYGSTVNGDGITEPDGFSTTLEQTGTYYLKAYAGFGMDTNGNPTPVPYTFQITASPNVEWPPPCTIPSIGNRVSLPHAEQLLVARGCSVGSVSSEHSTRVRRGYVITLKPRSGTSVAYHTPVAIVISSGRLSRVTKHRTEHKRKRKQGER
jgi:hypothetical protein